tara:strand:- start:81 stop:629 length:549 start_codon:yes stop_codon:yes gene_type:complete
MFMLSQPHSAVNGQNYAAIGSHSIQDAASNARNNFSPAQRAKRARASYQINKNNLMQPAIANNPQLATILGHANHRTMGNTENALQNLGLGGVSGAGLALGVLASYMSQTQKTRDKYTYAMLGGGFIALTASFFATNQSSWLVPLGISAMAGNLLGNNIFKVSSGRSNGKHSASTPFHKMRF